MAIVSVILLQSKRKERSRILFRQNRLIKAPIQYYSSTANTVQPKFFEGENFRCCARFPYSGIKFSRIQAFLKLNVCLDKYFEAKIFTVWNKTSKSAKIFTLEKFRLYGSISHDLGTYTQCVKPSLILNLVARKIFNLSAPDMRDRSPDTERARACAN